MYELIEHLKNKHWLWRGSETSLECECQTSGYPELDQQLGGGFPTQGVVELKTPVGIGEIRLLLPYLSQDSERLTVLINPPGNVSAEAFHHAGMPIDKILILTPTSSKEALWAAEQCLKSGACAHVLLWQDEIEVHQARRLQVASETGQCLQFLFRSVTKPLFSLPVTLSMRLKANDEGITISITKRKGGWPAEPFLVSFDHYWQNLTVPKSTSVVVPFPIRKQG
ncbi:translesion DNA synthesis-associated protein ImuA [Vibrio nitrifigilis]|uniref:Translesion DNA synthesis-associated protein ImuA n=1 Tax=Vibrio nitrifigilis TaxID=2789781 RepID=A0ABS0GB43_9VIBR|nr:translesion DNA synthesis-associated protein ImuA [Vibrio nitrifigilis]MBF8999629.1 translesion DNA synthesis-associated protein ImuA [Vibrio nitrifigilis]